MNVTPVVRDVAVGALVLTLECAPLALVLGGCVMGPPRLPDGAPATIRTERMSLGADTLDVELGAPRLADPTRPLILLVTGDGGWRPAERLLFEALARDGYEVAGLDAHAYLRHLRFKRTASDEVASELAQVRAFAARSLGLPPETAFILAGFSRGAGLAVTAAEHGRLRGQLVGLLALALTGEEEYVYHRHRHRHARVRDGSESSLVDPYDSLALLGPLPVAVIQSTQDGYLPAAEARRRFGPDTPWRRFVALDAHNHSFHGARDEMTREAGRAIAWILSAGAPLGPVARRREQP
jgi:dienelactone hydrolase